MPETSRADLELAWIDREQEASELIARVWLSTALCLRIYALEIRIKLAICLRLRLEYLPKACKTHDLTELIIFTGLWRELDDPANIQIRSYWEILADFSKKRLNDLHYQASAMLDVTEVSRLMKALDDPDHGVLAWLSRHL